MFDMSEKEVQAIHDDVDADIELNGMPTDDQLMAELMFLDGGGSGKNKLELALGV
jgi:hypothetical protein